MPFLAGLAFVTGFDRADAAFRRRVDFPADVAGDDLLDRRRGGLRAAGAGEHQNRQGGDGQRISASYRSKIGQHTWSTPRSVRP
jgi:hypothetical protein